MGRPKKVHGTFSHIPDIIRREGRVKGFEKLRDFTLEHWDTLKAQINPYSAIKLALEADRHALFAEVAELRKQGQNATELVADLQSYLQGRVDVSPDATGERVNIPRPASDGGFGPLDITDSEDEEEPIGASD